MRPPTRDDRNSLLVYLEAVPERLRAAYCFSKNVAGDLTRVTPGVYTATFFAAFCSYLRALIRSADLSPDPPAYREPTDPFEFALHRSGSGGVALRKLAREAGKMPWPKGYQGSNPDGRSSSTKSSRRNCEPTRPAAQINVFTQTAISPFSQRLSEPVHDFGSPPASGLPSPGDEGRTFVIARCLGKSLRHPAFSSNQRPSFSP